MPNIGATEIIVVLIIVLVVFGPKRLPELGRSLGRGLREFKTSVTGDDHHDDDQPPRALDGADDAAAGEGEQQRKTTSGT